MSSKTEFVYDWLRARAAPHSLSEANPQAQASSQLDSFARRAIFVGIVTCAVLCAAGLRWYRLGAQSLWLDEGFTAWSASLSLRNIIRVAQSSDFPPLYFMLERYWTSLFGNSEVGLRSLSALAGTLSLPVFYMLCKKVLRDSMAVALALWLFAFSIMQIWFSREARTYELASFIALVSLYELVVFLEKRTAVRFALIVACIAISIYLHNMLFFYVLGLNVTWLIYPSNRNWTERLKEVMIADGIAALCYLPWLPSLFHQVSARVVGGFWVARPTFEGLFQTLCILTGFFPDYLAAIASKLLPLPTHALWVGVLFAITVLYVLMIGGGFRGGSRIDKRKMIALLLYGLIPLIAVFVFSRVSTPVFLDRIFTNSSLIFPIVFAFPLAVQKNRTERGLFGILAVILAASAALSTVGYLRYTEKEDWRGATASVLRISEGNRLVVFVARTMQIPFDYYTDRLFKTGPHVEEMGLPIGYLERFPTIPGDSSITSKNQINKLMLAIDSKKYSEIDLVLSHEIYGDPHGFVLDYLDRSFPRHQEQLFYGVKVVRFFAPSNSQENWPPLQRGSTDSVEAVGGN